MNSSNDGSNDSNGVGMSSNNEERNTKKIKFQTLSLVGLGLTAAFFLVSIIPFFSLNWFIVTLFAISSGVILFLQMKNESGLESKILGYAILVVLAIFLIRNIVITQKYSTAVKAGKQILEYMDTYEYYDY